MIENHMVLPYADDEPETVRAEPDPDEVHDEIRQDRLDETARKRAENNRKVAARPVRGLSF